MTKKTEITDLTEASIIGVYLVQKMGKPTLDEIVTVAAKKLKAQIDPMLMERALAGCARAGRDFISVLSGQGGKGGQTRKEYCVKDLGRWKAPPEYAMIGDLLPQLLKEPANDAMKTWFDEYEQNSKKPESGDEGGEAKGGKGKKAAAAKGPRGNIVDSYHAFTAKVITLDTLLGSQIPGQYSDYIREKHPSAADELSVQGVFERDDMTGEYVIPSDVMRGWFMVNALRLAGLQDARANYVAFSPIRFKPKSAKEVKAVQVRMNAGKTVLQDGAGNIYDKSLQLKPGEKPYQHTMPVNTKMGASAPKTYEAIPAGQILEIRFSAPTKGLMSPEQLHRLFLEAGVRPRRGLSPARGCRFGKFMLLEWTDHGPLKEIAVDYIKNDIPAEVMAVYGPEINAQFAKLKNVRLTDLKDTSFSGTGGDAEGGFPMPDADELPPLNGHANGHAANGAAPAE